MIGDKYFLSRAYKEKPTACVSLFGEFPTRRQAAAFRNNLTNYAMEN